MEEASANETAVTQSKSSHAAPYKPIVLKLKKKKKKKRRYSRGLKEIQQINRDLNRASNRMTRAIAKGSSAYRKRSDKSAQKKRDGAIRDFFPNVGWAMSRSMRSASAIPYDVTKAFNTKRSRRRLRRQLRQTPRPLRIFRQ